MFAHNKTNVPMRRVAKAITARSLNIGFSTKINWVISSMRSIAAQISTSVIGFSATTARTPNAASRKEPVQLKEFGKLLRTTEVRMIAKQSVTMLNEKAQAIPSAVNLGDCEKSTAGPQTGNSRRIGIRVCQKKTLTQA